MELNEVVEDGTAAAALAVVWKTVAVTVVRVVRSKVLTEASDVDEVDVDTLVRLVKVVVTVVALSVVDATFVATDVTVVTVAVTVVAIDVCSIHGVAYGKSVKQSGMLPHCLTPTGVQAPVP